MHSTFVCFISSVNRYIILVHTFVLSPTVNISVAGWPVEQWEWDSRIWIDSLPRPSCPKAHPGWLGAIGWWLVPVLASFVCIASFLWPPMSWMRSSPRVELRLSVGTGWCLAGRLGASMRDDTIHRIRHARLGLPPPGLPLPAALPLGQLASPCHPRRHPLLRPMFFSTTVGGSVRCGGTRALGGGWGCSRAGEEASAAAWPRGGRRQLWQQRKGWERLSLELGHEMENRDKH
jgi:hypothetical protein